MKTFTFISIISIVYNLVMVTITLMLINLIIFILIRTNRLDPDDLSMSYYTVFVQKDYKRIITSAFAHYDIYHFLTNMFSLYNVGTIVEDLFGPVEMLILYFGSMILGKILSLHIRHARHDDYTMSLGASGAICGILGAYMLFVLFYLGMDAISYFYRPILSLVIMSIIPGVDGTSHISCLAVGMLLSYILIFFTN